MKTLPRSDIPKDFTYYRTGSRVFLDYLRSFRSYKVEWLIEDQEFFSAVQIFPGFWSVRAEKVDTEITRELLVEHGIHHAIIWWTPMRVIERPRGWARLPSLWTRYAIHSSRSAFAILDRPDYWSKWSPSARAHRRKVMENKEKGIIKIRKDIGLTEFLDLYKNTPSKDSDKGFRSRIAKKLFEKTTTDYRIYTIEVGGEILAGAIFIDIGTTSEYYMSFYHRDGYPYHLGIAMMDQCYILTSNATL